MIKLAIDLAPQGGFKGFGPFGLEGAVSPESGAALFNSFVSRAIGVITVVAFVWFVFIVLTGAIGIISSGGDKQALESARKRITSGLVGVIVVIASLFIVSFLGQFLGIQGILDPAGIIGKIAK